MTHTLDATAIPAAPTVAAVLDQYWREHGHATRSATRQRGCIRRLKHHLGDTAVDVLGAGDVRGFTAARKTQGCADGTVRRDLIVLRAAMRHCEREGAIAHARMIPMPPPGPPRDRWLTRGEAARLLWATRRMWVRRHRPAYRSLIFTALYTGTRFGALRRLGWTPSPGRGWIDLDAGILYRSGTAELRTKKRKTPVPIPARLLRHLRAMRRRSDAPPFAAVRPYPHRTFRSLYRRAGLGGDVVFHTLRHTCATWLAQRGAPIWQAAGFLGMTVEMFEAVYGHHHPAYLAEAAAALDARPTVAPVARPQNAQVPAPPQKQGSDDNTMAWL